MRKIAKGTAQRILPVVVAVTVRPLCWLLAKGARWKEEIKKKEKKSAPALFRATDVWIMLA